MRGFGIVAAILCVLALIAWFAWVSVVQSDRTAWNTWVNMVSLACQEGNDSATVQRMLGKPKFVRVPGERLSNLTPEAHVPPGVTTIYGYSRFSVLSGFWEAYVYLDESGRVRGYHVGYN